MKLVELLAKEMDKWPEDCNCGYCMQANETTLVFFGGPAKSVFLSELADDRVNAKVTTAQWQAERDRQKVGDWKRHRGGVQPIEDGVSIEVRHRDGEIVATEAGSKGAIRWKHTGQPGDIMSYRVISQPQAEEIPMIADGDAREYKGPFPCSPIGEAVHALEWDIEFPSGVFKWEAQVDQIDGPSKWRDTIIHCQAIIEDCEREMAANENLLALEGFALIPAMTPVMGVADIVFPIEEWQIGDIVEVTSVSCESAAPLGVFTITDIDSSEPKYELDDQYFPNHNQMKFIRRP